MATITSTTGVNNLIVNIVDSTAAFSEMQNSNQINPNELYFITEDTSPNNLYIRVNNTTYTYNTSSIVYVPNFYAPVTSGTSGYILQSNGSGAPTWVAPSSQYELPQASSAALGGVKIGLTQSGRNYPLLLNASGVAYVNVPWETTSYVFDGTYNSSTNKAATVQTVTSAINNLDVSAITGTAAQTITSISETNGKISATYSSISIAPSQINDAIPNSKLANSSISIAGTSVSLGDSISASSLKSALNLTQALNFKGITSAAIADGNNIVPTDLGITNYEPTVGDVVIDSNTQYEYVWVKGTGFLTGRWERLGSDSSYAISGTEIKFTPKGTINNHSYTPAGSVSQPTFSGSASTLTFSATPSGSVTVTATENTNGNYQPKGTVSKPTFTGTSGAVSVSGTPSGGVMISAATPTSSADTTYIPDGTISQPTFTGTAKTVSVSGTASGSNAASQVTITPNTTSIYQMSSTGSVTAGTSATFTQGTDSFTPNTPTAIDTTKFSGGSYSHTGWSSGSLPTFSMSVDANETLTVSFGQGTLPAYGTDSFTAAKFNTGFYTAGTAATFTQGTDSFTQNKPTAVTLPSRSSTTVWNGYQTGVSKTYAAAQTWTPATSTFTGTYTASGTVSTPGFTGTGVKFVATFNGSATTFNGSFTPSGSVSQPSFTGTKVQLDGSFSGTALSSSISYTPSGTVTKPTFSGTAATLTHTFTGTEETITL